MRERFDFKIATLATELEPHELAAAIGGRNGWLGIAATVLALICGGVIYRMSRMPAAPSVSVSVAAR